MTFLGVVALVIVALVSALAILVLIGLVRIRRMRGDHQRRVLAEGQTELDSQATFFGLASGGREQAMAPGTLLLTTGEIVFVQVVGPREARISRDSITSCRATRHFLGKTSGRDLLVVTWDANGLGDAAAFDVPDTEPWRERLDPQAS